MDDAEMALDDLIRSAEARSDPSLMLSPYAEQLAEAIVRAGDPLRVSRWAPS